MCLRDRIGPTLVAIATLAFCLATNPLDRSLEGATAHAHSFVEVSVEYLAHIADRVVVAAAEEEVSVWESDQDARRIVTYHRLRVQSNIVGKGDDDIWVRRLGGVVGKVGQRVHGSAPIRRGKTFLLFLKRRVDGNFGVIGMEQGLFPILIPKGKKKPILGRRGISHAPVSSKTKSRLTPASALEGRKLEEVRRIVVEARKRHAD